MSASRLGIVAPHPPIMVPQVGGPDAEVTRASIDAMHGAARALRHFAPETVVLMSPHAHAFRDAFIVRTASRLHGDLGQFGAPGVSHEGPGDPELAAAILAEAESAGIPAVADEMARGLASGPLDHGVLVPMSFLDPGAEYPLVVTSLSFLPYEQHRHFGEAIAAAADRIGRRVAFVASGDCSHRLVPQAPAGYSPRAHLFDEELVRLLGASDFAGLSDIDEELIDEAGECGLRSFITLGGFLEGAETTGKVLAYEGPWGVGYLTAVFGAAEDVAAAETSDPAASGATPASGSKGGMRGADESAPVRLARATIEAYVGEDPLPDPSGYPEPLLRTRAGAFVSLHRGGALRGCIGTIGPTEPTLGEEISRNAVQAATSDPRFPPLRPDELADLEIGVDVLHEPEPASCLEDLDVKRYGVIVTSGWKRGLLLPDLEGVDTPEEQVSIAMHKAGIASGETITLERFQVDRYC